MLLNEFLHDFALLQAWRLRAVRRPPWFGSNKEPVLSLHRPEGQRWLLQVARV